MRRLVLVLCFCYPTVFFAQVGGALLSKKNVKVTDTIRIDSVSINPFHFQVFTTEAQHIPSKAYTVDFTKGLLFPGDSLLAHSDSLRIRYKKYPEFLTKSYYQFDPNRIVTTRHHKKGLYQLGTSRNKQKFEPFDGLNTSGSISRGITVGSNQNSVLNSKLDLQITGKITNNVHIRASIQDSDIPIQQGGYSQRLNQFDQVFVELYSENWRIRGGDIDLVKDNSYFGNFHKKVQGLSVQANLTPNGNPTKVYAAGAIVRGVFTRNQFKALEGNQGPYKLTGPNGELYALVISGSETVYVNGIRLTRGENNDYVIDYNAGEIIFNATFPVKAGMRITVEFQYADRNYSRIVATGGVEHQAEKWEIGGFIYSENDLRNQPLQQDLSDGQKQTLADAGDDETQMVAPSAIPSEFSENNVLYQQDTVNGQLIYVYSTDPNDQLYLVKFSFVGPNQGNYIISNRPTIRTVYEYIAPSNGIKQGNYAPVTRLYAPTKLQMAVINGGYHPSEKTDFNFELAVSSHDKNLYSDLDEGDNDGFAGHFDIAQTLYADADSTKIKAFANVNFIQDNFESIEPLYQVEFNRNWNLITPEGNQSYIKAGLSYSQPKHGFAKYSFQKLAYSDTFNGSRQVLQAGLRFGDFTTQVSGSFLTSDGPQYQSEFLQVHLKGIYHFDPFWTGAEFDAEDNQQYDKLTTALTGLSQRFHSYKFFAGVGDSTAIYAEIGYRHRVNDSLRHTRLQRVSASDNYYIKSQLVNTANSRLSVFINYRRLKQSDLEDKLIQSLNSRLLYQQSLFNNLLNLHTLYETSSGNLPQLEYTYVKVEPGQGRYTWNDYNQNGVQELDEFEIAPYPDQAEYIRVLLPNRVFIKTRKNKFSQIITLNFAQLNDDSTQESWLSHFYNQTTYLVNRKVKHDGANFNLNPFSSQGEELAVNLNFRNTLYFNRGKQHYTSSYSYISSQSKNLFSTGLQAHQLESHQLQFTHKIGASWLFNLNGQLNHTKSQYENFNSREYTIDGYAIAPKISYLLTRNTRFNLYYKYNHQQNKIGDLEQLNRQKLGTSFHFSHGRKYAITGEFNFIYNNFDGQAFSPVAYEMLQGLQPAKNYTWQVLFQKKITQYLDLNLSYHGRKSEGAPTIHTGSVELKAYF